MTVPRTIDWTTISEDHFNEVVEALLVKEWTTPSGLRAEAIDGRGGDEGIDVGVWRGDSLVHVFQLKYFREGFSGYAKKTRRDQIAGSFERALKAHPGLSDWSLVIPSKGSLPERKYVSLLSAGKAIRTHTMGSTQLDLLLAKHPELNRWAWRR